MFGWVSGIAKKGRKISVRLANGTTKSFTAETDIVSNPVWVAGDRVMSKERSQVILERTTQLFKSRVGGEEEIEYPWAYLFSIDDFTADDSTVNYIDPTWGIDDLEGHYKSFGNGSGEYRLLQDLLNVFDPFTTKVETLSPLTHGLTQQINNVFVISEDPQYLGFDPNSTEGSNAMSDGVNKTPFGTRSGANEQFVNSGLISRPIYPERQYLVKERSTQGRFTINYNGSIYSIRLRSDSNGTVIYRWGRYVSGSNTGVYEDNEGVITESYSTTNTAFVTQTRARILNAIAAVENVVTMPLLPQGTVFDGQIFTGQQLLNGDAFQVFDSGAVFPDEVIYDGDNLTTTIDYQDISYVAQTYLLPINKTRNIGTKQIFCQVRENPKLLLTTMPSFEAWDGYISPLDTGEVEVVIKRGKRYHPSLYFDFVGRRIVTGHDLEWSQLTVYLVDANGKLVSQQEYNNSETILNPGNSPDEITISDSNWQKPWLDYQDWRTVALFSYKPFPGNFVEPYQGTGEIDSLETGLRSRYSEKLTGVFKTVSDRNKSTREIIPSLGLGTVSPKSDTFYYCDPLDLADKNVALDYALSFGVRLFPSLNYSIFSSAFNESQTESKYYQLTGASYSGSFNEGFSIEKTTNYPKLDLIDELSQGLKLPAEITTADWNTEWSEDPEINTNLLRFGLRAIAYLN